MNKIETFTEFLTTQSPTVPLLTFVLNLILAAILGYVLNRIYIKYGDSLSNRRMFANNFILLTTTTMIIITIVKSSLALSLGLVGALSIVRFRAAIKEPEELSYLFLTIAVGLGLGADQTSITLVGFAVVVAIIIIRKFFHRKDENQNLLLTISSNNPEKLSLEAIVQVLQKYCSSVALKRVDEMKEMIEAAFMVEFEKFENFNNSKKELQELNESVKITFLDNKGIVS